MCVAGLAVLAGHSNVAYLVPYVLGFGAFVFIVLLAAVVILNFKYPEKLMLGNVTGSEYVEIQHATLGDSRSGELVMPITRAPYSGESAIVEVPSRPSDSNLETFENNE